MSFLGGYFFGRIGGKFFLTPGFRIDPFTTFISYLKNWKSCQKKNLLQRIQPRKNLC
jgi:hypothetical protein